MKKKAIPFALVLGALALMAGCSEEAPPSAQMPTPTVTVVEVRPEEVTLTRKLPGRTVAYLVAEVRPQVDGIVQERLFEEGSLVEAGQPLYQLDDTLYQAQSKMAKAQVESAKSAAKLARTDSERSRELYEANAISKQDFDRSQAALQRAEAELGVAEASLDSAQARLGYSRIVSPISGRIGRSAVTKGALVTANQATPLATVLQLDPIYVDISQSSRELLQLRRSLAEGGLTESDIPVTIELEDGSTYDHQGKIAFSEAYVDPTTGSYTLRIVVDNPEGLLLPGMYVRAEIGKGVRQNAILVPQKAVARSPNGATTVMVVNDAGVIDARAVELSESIGNRWLVRNGLNAGDRVVVTGLQKVQPGAQVNVEPQSPPADPEEAAN